MSETVTFAMEAKRITELLTVAQSAALNQIEMFAPACRALAEMLMTCEQLRLKLTEEPVRIALRMEMGPDERHHYNMGVQWEPDAPLPEIISRFECLFQAVAYTLAYLVARQAAGDAVEGSKP